MNSNYRPISKLSLISKIIQRIVKSRLYDHLTSNNLVNHHQSAYSKRHSTETALLYTYILLTRLCSWFGIHGTALNCMGLDPIFPFAVFVSNAITAYTLVFCDVPQGSVLCPLLFIMHTTPLSTLILSLSLNHHQYADDTQLFISFHLSDFHSNITHLQNALQQISS